MPRCSYQIWQKCTSNMPKEKVERVRKNFEEMLSTFQSKENVWNDLIKNQVVIESKEFLPRNVEEEFIHLPSLSRLSARIPFKKNSKKTISKLNGFQEQERAGNTETKFKQVVEQSICRPELALKLKPEVEKILRKKLSIRLEKESMDTILPHENLQQTVFENPWLVAVKEETRLEPIGSKIMWSLTTKPILNTSSMTI